jgi:hypothetical protein
MQNKLKGLIFYTKNIKDNDLYMKVLSSNDYVNSGIVYGGNSSKKKSIYQKGYFIDFIYKKKNENSPLVFTAEISRPYIGNIYEDKFKLNAIASVLSLINISIFDGQQIKGFYSGVFKLISNINNKDKWIIFYCEWLFDLLKFIGYQIDYNLNFNKKYFDLSHQEFTSLRGKNCIEFPHDFFQNYSNINHSTLETIFNVFENIFSKNHLENINYKMPESFKNFKKITLSQLK